MRANRLTEKPSLCLALAGGVFAALLAGCGEEPKSPPSRSEAGVARPADAELAQVYDNSCKLCHANPAAGAPLTGDMKAWEPRVLQGAGTLLDHAINEPAGQPGHVHRTHHRGSRLQRRAQLSPGFQALDRHEPECVPQRKPQRGLISL